MKQWKLCNNCLSLQHSTGNCTSRYACRECDGKHHSLLHDPCHGKSNNTNTTVPDPTVEEDSIVVGTQPINALHGQGTRSLGEKSVLPTFKVQVAGKGGTVMARGFVDTGSAISCVTSRLATSIKAKMKQQLTLYSSFRMEEASTCHHVATMQLHPSNGKTAVIPMCLAVVDNIFETLPACNMPGIMRALSKLTPLQLADPNQEG